MSQVCNRLKSQRGTAGFALCPQLFLITLAGISQTGAWVALNHMAPLPTMPPEGLRCRLSVCSAAQSCLCDAVDRSSPGSSAHEIPQAIEYWSSLPFSISGDLPDPGIKPTDSGPPAATAAAKSLQSCPTLCDPIDGSRPGSPVPGILQARTLEWVAISFSNA